MLKKFVIHFVTLKQEIQSPPSKSPRKKTPRKKTPTKKSPRKGADSTRGVVGMRKGGILGSCA
jgi:hypothetical protein